LLFQTATFHFEMTNATLRSEMAEYNCSKKQVALQIG